MTQKPIKIIFIGDVVGKLGRRALAQIVSAWRKKYQVDEFIANVENLAHGKGVTEPTLAELQALGLHIFTGGNHVWSKAGVDLLLQNPDLTLVVPANDSRALPEAGARVITAGGVKFLLVNLVGQIFMVDEQVTTTNPFEAIDEILAHKDPSVVGVIIDFHAEATSEKIAFGWYLDGRATAVCGTHTHVPTADAKILPNHTAYITDVGMVGGVQTVLGVAKDVIVNRFAGNQKSSFEYPDAGEAEVNAVLLTIDGASGQAISIEHLHENVVI